MSGTPSPNPETGTPPPRMNAETHKVIRAVYTHYQFFAVPKEWEMDEIGVKYNTLYYKDEEVEGVLDADDGMKYPDDITEEDFDEYNDFFDCDEV